MPQFVTAAQVVAAYDWRWIAQNITDTGIPATEAQVLASTKLAGFIEEASETILGACAVGARYSLTDLETYGGALLRRITCDLVMGLILKRRVRAVKDTEAYTAAYEEALNYLELLRRGERVFYAVPNVPEAGLPTTENLAPTPSSTGQPLITDNSRIFGSIGWDRNYGYGNRGGC